MVQRLNIGKNTGVGNLTKMDIGLLYLAMLPFFFVHCYVLLAYIGALCDSALW